MLVSIDSHGKFKFRRAKPPWWWIPRTSKDRRPVSILCYMLSKSARDRCKSLGFETSESEREYCNSNLPLDHYCIILVLPPRFLKRRSDSHLVSNLNLECTIRAHQEAQIFIKQFFNKFNKSCSNLLIHFHVTNFSLFLIQICGKSR